jgi:hypothetical protein
VRPGRVKMLRKIAVGLLAAGLLAAAAVGTAGADANPSGTGQPSQSCEEQTSAPPGFGTGGFATAEGVYAGSQPQNSGNPASVAQYDVACYQVSQ